MFLQELSDLCREVTGNHVPIGSDPQNRPNDLRLFIGDCSKLKREHNWKPRRTIPGIVQDTHRWVEANAEALQAL